MLASTTSRRPCARALLQVVAMAAGLASLAPTANQDRGLADPGAIERAFEDIAGRVGPSVVSIRVERRHVLPAADAIQETGGVSEQLVLVNGAGTVISPDGLILTNEHVVQSAASIKVSLADGKQLPADVVAADPRSDLAVLRIPCAKLTPASFCDWSTVRRGQWAVILGNPFGLGADGQASVSVGIISNLGRSLPGLGEVDDRFYGNMIQTTAAINPGNSGGPLLNLAGEVVGVVTAMHTRSGQSDGVGFAIPMTPAKRSVVQRLCRGQPIEYGYLGVTVEPRRNDVEVTSGAGGSASTLDGPQVGSRGAGDQGGESRNGRSDSGLGYDRGVVVVRVDNDSPAADAGLGEGDLILDVDEQPITSPAQLSELTGLATVGQPVAVRYLRGGREHTCRPIIARREVSRVSWLRGESVLWRGVRLANLTRDAREKTALPEDVHGILVIDVAANTAGSRAQLKIGDVIENVGGSAVHDVRGFLEAVRTTNGPLQLTLRRGVIRVVEP